MDLWQKKMSNIEAVCQSMGCFGLRQQSFPPNLAEPAQSHLSNGPPRVVRYCFLSPHQIKSAFSFASDVGHSYSKRHITLYQSHVIQKFQIIFMCVPQSWNNFHITNLSAYLVSSFLQDLSFRMMVWVIPSACLGTTYKEVDISLTVSCIMLLLELWAKPMAQPAALGTYRHCEWVGRAAPQPTRARAAPPGLACPVDAQTKRAWLAHWYEPDPCSDYRTEYELETMSDSLSLSLPCCIGREIWVNLVIIW